MAITQLFFSSSQTWCALATRNPNLTFHNGYQSDQSPGGLLEESWKCPRVKTFLPFIEYVCLCKVTIYILNGNYLKLISRIELMYRTKYKGNSIANFTLYLDLKFISLNRKSNNFESIFSPIHFIGETHN